MDNEDKVKKFLKQHNGYITTAEFISLDIGRHLIPKYIKSGLIRKVSHGIYIENSLLEDPYYILQKKYPHVIYSFNTAFFILNLTNRTPDKIDISVLKGKRVRGNYNIHYVSQKYYDIGIIDVFSPAGNKIRIYNAERCICDIIRSKKRMDLEHVKYAVKEYLKRKDNNLIKLSKYADMFGIKEEVMNFVSMVYE